MRLIDANKLKEATRKTLCPDKNLMLHVIYAMLEEIIDEQPEAYSVDEVVEELEKESVNVMLPNGFREPCVTLKTAETIVKAGGIDEIN